MLDISYNSTYRIRARGLPNWQSHDTVRLEISVGQEYHEGEKLDATMRWAERNFKHTYLLLGDYIQRYNLNFAGIKNADMQAIKDGDLWLERNTHILPSNINIIRWQDVYLWPEFKEQYQKSHHAYKSIREFHEAVNIAINENWQRGLIRQDSGFILDRYREFFDMSKAYLLEETAIFSCIFQKIKGVSAYPGDFLEMWSMFIDNDIAGAPDGLKYAHALRIVFNRRNPKVPASHVDRSVLRA